ncbi:unnamed protein product, partial [marine sediment metagenome]
MLNRLLFIGLMLLVLLSPLPLGSNREWSWSLCALIAAILAVLWSVVNVRKASQINSRLHPGILVLFAVACGWAIVQLVSWSPSAWQHPLWS